MSSFDDIPALPGAQGLPEPIESQTVVHDVSILLIEDEQAHFELIRRLLVRSRDWQVNLTHCTTLKDSLDTLSAGGIDVILCDLHLPDSRGLDTLRAILDWAGSVPVLILTSLDDAQFGYRAVQQGADDFLVKSDLSPGLLMRAVLYAIERRKSRARLRQTNRELVRINRDLENFVRFVSHDLRTPLAVIRMEIETAENFIGRQGSQDAQLTALLSAREELDHSIQLIEDLLTFARLAGQKSPPQPVQLRPLIEQAMDRAMMNVPAPQTPRLEVDAMPTVPGHESLLRQLFENLFSNALKYRSDRPPSIHVSCQDGPDEWHLQIADNGRGIPPADRQRVFQPFHRAEAHDAVPGTGIGLAIVQRVAQLHDGHIYVTENPTGGSIFHLHLPHRLEAPAPVPQEPSASPLVT